MAQISDPGATRNERPAQSFRGGIYSESRVSLYPRAVGGCVVENGCG